MRNRLGAAPEQLKQAKRKSSGQNRDAGIWFWSREGLSVTDWPAKFSSASGIDKKSEFPPPVNYFWQD
jgi:hypothetical protein